MRTLAPERSALEGGVSVNRGYTWARVEASADLEYGYGPGDDDDDDIGWYGANRVQLGWSDLACLGDGDVLVVMDYLTAGGTATSITRHYESGIAASGVTVSWDDSGGDDGGISRVTGLRVYKKDTYGNWKRIIDQQGRLGQSGNFVDIAAPADPGCGSGWNCARLAATGAKPGWSITASRCAMTRPACPSAAMNIGCRGSAVTASSRPKVAAL
ncbi:hypothetical protein WJ972_07325 [Achromobacter insuavis]